MIGVKRFAGPRTQLVDPDARMHRGKMLVGIAGNEGPEIGGLLAQGIGDPEILPALSTCDQPVLAAITVDSTGVSGNRFLPFKSTSNLSTIAHHPIGGEASAVPREFPSCRRSVSCRCTGMEPTCSMHERIHPAKPQATRSQVAETHLRNGTGMPGRAFGSRSCRS